MKVEWVDSHLNVDEIMFFFFSGEMHIFFIQCILYNMCILFIL